MPDKLKDSRALRAKQTDDANEDGVNSSTAHTADRQPERQDDNTSTTAIRRVSMADLNAKSDGLGIQLNNTRGNLRVANGNLRSAREWLGELKKNAPMLSMPVGGHLPMGNLRKALSTIGIWLKDLDVASPKPNSRKPGLRVGTNKVGLALDLISGSSAILDSEKSFRDSRSYGALIAKQKGIVSELEGVVNDLEQEDHEILARIADTEREKEEFKARYGKE